MTDTERALREALERIAHGPYAVKYEYERLEECQRIASEALTYVPAAALSDEALARIAWEERRNAPAACPEGPWRIRESDAPGTIGMWIVESDNFTKPDILVETEREARAVCDALNGLKRP